MFIVNQNRNMMVNADHITHVYIENNTRIVAGTSRGGDIVLGNYKNCNCECRADEVFKEMLSNMFVPNLIAINTEVSANFSKGFKEWSTMPWGVSLEGENVDIKTVERAAYYMPEE